MVSMTTFKQKGHFKDHFQGKCNFEENTDSSVLNEENFGEGFHQHINASWL